MSYRGRHDSSPFVESRAPSPRWAYAKEWRRRPLLPKQIILLAIVSVFILPLWFLNFQRQDYARAQLAVDDFELPVPSSFGSGSSFINTHPAVQAEKFPPRPHNGINIHKSDVAISTPPQPPTFSFIMFSADAAAEGAVLIKSIILYSSTPTHFHIICDESAQEYLEKRLALVKRPKNNVLVRFYRLTWDDMVGRINREGALHTDHSAGVPGLMKLFIHEILPSTVERSIFIDTDAFFVSDPLLLWQQFDKFGPNTAISMPSHPEMAAEEWHNANRICSCIMLLDLKRLRNLRLMDSSVYRAAGDHHTALAPPAFTAMFGPPETNGHYENVKLGDQGYWWAIVSHRPDIFKHLSFDWEVSSCLLDMYYTGLGRDDATVDDELRSQVHTVGTPHEGQVVIPKMLHFNCLDGTPRYYEWEGWDDPNNSLTRRWGAAMHYHVGFKWLWLNQAQGDDTTITLETVQNVMFADEIYAKAVSSGTMDV